MFTTADPPSTRPAHRRALLGGERVDFVTPFRLPAPELAQYEDACRAILARSAFRTGGGWSDRAAALLGTSFGVDEGSAEWAVTMYRSGTDALVRALLACGVRAKDGVAVPDLAFHAVASAVLMVGAVPVPVDIEPSTWCMDPVALRESCAPGSVAAVIAVDNYGTPCDAAGLSDVAHRLGVPLIVDACESLGATRPNDVLEHADAIVVSFSFTKPVHAAGMGGALALRRSHVRARDSVRWTDRQYALPELNAAHLVLAWPFLATNIDGLRRTYATYERSVVPFGALAQSERGRSTRIHAPFLLPDALAERRPHLLRSLEAAGITCRAQFPSQSELLGLGVPPPVSRHVADRVLCLPTGAGLLDASVALVAQEAARVLAEFDGSNSAS